MSQQLWGPALEAEVAYRREVAAKAYRRRTATPVVVRAWRRSRAWVAARHAEHSEVVAARSRETIARLGDTLDTIAARTDRTGWDTQVSGRGVRFQNPMDAMRPHEGAGRHVA